MHDTLMQVQTQPFVKLAQANIELLSRFATSPEVGAQASANVSQMLQLATESAMALMHSGAFAHLMQGLLTNYTTFLSDLGQGGMAMMNEGQAMMTRQLQDAAAGAVDVADVRGRRTRQAA